MKRYADIDDPSRSVIGLSDEYASGFTDPFHSHERAQLLFASSGIMTVEVSHASYVIPPGRALWIPRGVMHQVSCRSAVSLRTLYFTEERIDPVGECRILEVSNFLRALILEAVDFNVEENNRRREEQIVQLLAGEIAAMPTAPYHIVMPSDDRLVSICQEILKNPADRRDLEDWAAFAGMGKRTLTRLFRAETGMGVSAWRQQARLLEALSLLASGKPVTVAAYAVGYESPSAFASAFRKTFGAPPSKHNLRSSGTTAN